MSEHDLIPTRIAWLRAWNRLQRSQMPDKWPRNRSGFYRMRISRDEAERVLCTGLADPGDFIIMQPRVRTAPESRA